MLEIKEYVGHEPKQVKQTKVKVDKQKATKAEARK